LYALDEYGGVWQFVEEENYWHELSYKRFRLEKYRRKLDEIREKAKEKDLDRIIDIFREAKKEFIR
jgi:hypothetical protein